MSACPFVDPPIMPTMVSRLPKFGSRPRSQTAPATPSGTGSAATAAGSTRLTNGFYHHPGPAGGAATPSSGKQNGFIRVPTSFSMKWRRENPAAEDGDGEWRAGKGGNAVQLYSQRQHKPSPSPQSSPRTVPVSKNGPRSSKPSQATPGLANGTQKTLNGSPGPRPRTAASSSLRKPQTFARLAGPCSGSGPGSRSSSPLLKKSPASRSQSSDSLGCVATIQLTENDRLRSRSLTQVRQLPPPTLTSSLPRSPSVTRQPVNRTSQRGPPSPSMLIPTRSLLKSPAPNPTGRTRSSAASGKTGGGAPTPLPSLAMKKPLLPSLGPTSKPSGISYKLSRPSLIKQSRPFRATPANQEVNRGPSRRRNSVETPSTAENSPAENTPEAPETDGLTADPVSQREASMVGETLEDMSLSSTSSLDRNDISQEFMDDFDNLGNGGMGILLLSSKNDEDDSGLDQSCTRFDDDKVAVNGGDTVTGLSFLDDADWTGIDGERREHRLNRLSRQRRSSQADYHEQGGSSLDLSPSDSCGSGGTYMWDEEGLEPLGGAATTASIHTNSSTTHPIGSFDSDINSIDLLNNLDTCDLGDDDLMLDVDFPEDTSLHSDGDLMSHVSQMAQWRKRQLCWGTQDVQNDNETDFQSYRLTEDPGNKRLDQKRDGDLILELCHSRSACLSPGSPSLGLDVEELAEDCSAVRSQLQFLQSVLLQEEDMDDDTLTTETLSPEDVASSRSSDSQVQVLLQEVQQLREELRSRDRTIAQLTLQLAVPTATARCRCQETRGRVDGHTQTSVQESESVSSQTPWREDTVKTHTHSQILHSSSQKDQEPMMTLLPSQVPPPGNSAQPETPADTFLHPAKHATDRTPQRGGDDGKTQRKEEEEMGNRAASSSRSLLQPSKLRLFLSRSSDPISQKTRASRQPSAPRDADGSSGARLKEMTLASGSSRLPKPKSH